MHRTPSHTSVVHHWISFLLDILHCPVPQAGGRMPWADFLSVCPTMPQLCQANCPAPTPSSCWPQIGAPERSLSACWEQPPFLYSHMAHPPQQPSPHSAVWAERTLANYAGLKITTLPCCPAAGPICVGPVVRGNKVPPVEPGRPQVWSYRYKQEGNEGNNYQLLQVKAPLKLQ